MRLWWKAAYHFHRFTSVTTKVPRSREITFLSIGLLIAFAWVFGLAQNPEANLAGAPVAFLIAGSLVGLGLFWRHVRRQSAINPHYLSEKARG